MTCLSGMTDLKQSNLIVVLRNVSSTSSDARGKYMDQKLEGWLPAKKGRSSQPSREGDGTGAV